MDIPERLQTKIGIERLSPSEDELVEEAKWIFNSIIVELRCNRKEELFEIIKSKIYRVLRMIRKIRGDIPWICRYGGRAEVAPELETKDIWRIFNLDIEYGKL